jgi:ATP-dependent Clp protease ATP-binding subunit ClpC
MLNEVFGRFTKQGLALQVKDKFKDHLVEEGYKAKARPLRRAIMNVAE